MEVLQETTCCFLPGRPFLYRLSLFESAEHNAVYDIHLFYRKERPMKKMKLTAVLLCLALCVLTLAGCGDTETKNETNQTGSNTTAASSETEKSTSALMNQSETLKEFSEEELLSGKHHVEMDIQDHGTVTLELDADQAPVSVTSFIQLAKDGFYNGLTFHRIINGQFVQGGDPLGNGTGGPGYTIKGEFAANGVNNTLSHTRGAISMARTSNYDGGGCQFFIMDSDYTGFDGQYACFGYVTDGMDYIDEICNNTQMQDSNGTIAPEDQPVISEIRVID